MQRSIYTLLVGIDKYPAPISQLRGCINDVVEIEQYLKHRIDKSSFKLRSLVLKDHKATRDAIIGGFRNHLCNAAKSDIAMFYFAGHGSQEPCPPEFWHIEPDRLDETLVCWDSRTAGQWDLADKELSKLIAEVAAAGAQVIVVLDSCHSGSGTRGPLQETTVRRIPTDHRRRPINSFIFSSEDIPALPAIRNRSSGPSDWITLPEGKHTLLAACRADQLAGECFLGGKHHGIFTNALLSVLRGASNKLTYRDLIKWVAATVRSKIASQSPQIEVSSPEDLDRFFLSQAIAKRTSYFTISHDAHFGWIMDGGGVHGIKTLSSDETDETIALALFPYSATAEQMKELSSALHHAEVVKVFPHFSKVEIKVKDTLDQNSMFKALVIKLPLPSMKMRIEGEEEGVLLARQELSISSSDASASLGMQESNADPDLKLIAKQGQYTIVRGSDNIPLAAGLRGYTPLNARLSIHRLEHIARWKHINELDNPGSRIPSDAIRITICKDEMEIDESEVKLHYRYEEGYWKNPSFKLKLSNGWTERLYCALLALSESYAVDSGFFPAGGVWLGPGEEAWALQKRSIPAVVPEDFYERGVTQLTDILKLIVCTEEFDPRLLEQGKLDTPARGYATRSMTRKSTLNRLMLRIHARHILSNPYEDEIYDDWRAAKIAVITSRPRSLVTLASAGSAVSLGSGVAVEPHAEFRADARLTTVAQSSGDLINTILPPILRDNPSLTPPLQFSSATASDPGLSIIEFRNVESYHAVTPNNPLRLNIDYKITGDEHLLAVGYDGEFFLPLGRYEAVGDKTQIILERLPSPVAEGRRSLSGSIRVLIQKIINEGVGCDKDYPILAVADIDANGNIGYEKDPAKVREKVADAKRILLCMHGIIGSARTIARAARRLSPNDLLLIFDYENINTTIQDTAKTLKNRLQSVGLGAGHKKQLRIVAHSAGALVSRWLIEKEGGNHTIQHLIMMGSPNQGLVWPTLQTLAGACLGIALNGLSAIVWPASVLCPLVAAFGTVDVSLDQMRPGSEPLKELELASDPGIPYTIIAGNSSLINAAVGKDLNEAKTIFERLMGRLLLGGLMDQSSALAFFCNPNDIAVSVESIMRVSNRRIEAEEVSCDHLTYFSNEQSLAALARAINRAMV